MRKIIFFFTALLLPFFAFEMNADDEIAVITIPLKVDVEQNLNRGIIQDLICGNKQYQCLEVASQYIYLH